jgi:hypothetical protein
VETPKASSASPRWGWARLLKRVFAFDMERCPACGRGTLRIIAAITHADVIRKILCPLTLVAEPPPVTPARACHATFAWTSPSPDSASSHVPWEQGMVGVRPVRHTLAACGEHERVRDVSWSTRRGFWVRRGGSTRGRSRGVSRVRVPGERHENLL